MSSQSSAALRKIVVCQNTVCQNKGSKSVLHRLESLYEEQYREQYPKLQIISGECMGECDQGPNIQVNESIWLRDFDTKQAEELMKNPEAVLGQVMHVREQDRETFERIITGELY